MRLSDTEDLKFELLDGLESRLRVRGDRAEETAIAIGVATTERRGDYLVAVRPRREPSDTILDYIEKTTGGEIDLHVTGDIVPLGTLVMPGLSTTHRQGRVGTLGFFARRRRDERVGFVSNNHVIAAEDEGRDGDEVVLPAVPDGELPLERVVGYLDGNYPRLTGSRDPRTVDCAFAVLADDFEYDVTIAGEYLSPVPVAPEEAADARAAVSKVGRTTKRTCGRVTAFRLDEVYINYSFRLLPFRSQIEIDSFDGQPFSRGGDSGSLVFTADRHPLALLFACSARGRTYANPIQEVLDTLGVELLT
jgi:hypothetical protein